MLVETRARNLTTAPEVAENIRRTRAYLRSLTAPPHPTEPGDAPANINRTGVGVLQAIAVRTGLDCHTILLDVEAPVAIEARRIAMAICVLHLGMHEDAIGLLFGVHSDAAVRAAEHYRPFYLDAAIPEGAQSFAVACAFCAEFIGPPPAAKVPAKEIMHEICKQFDVTGFDLKSPRQDAETVRARMSAMVLMRRLTLLSFPEIGRHVLRDPSTVQHSCKRMKLHLDAAERILPARATIAQWVTALREQIERGLRP